MLDGERYTKLPAHRIIPGIFGPKLSVKFSSSSWGAACVGGTGQIDFSQNARVGLKIDSLGAANLHATTNTLATAVGSAPWVALDLAVAVAGGIRSGNKADDQGEDGGELHDAGV